jgi:hypothetical protein
MYFLNITDNGTPLLCAGRIISTEFNLETMTNLEIFKAKQEFNKWLKELTETEKSLIMEMMDEARELGYDKGIKDARYEDVS